MKKYLVASFVLLFSIIRPAFGQKNIFNEIDLDGNTHLISSIELSPDKKTLAIATAGGPIFIWDIESQKILRKIEIEGNPWGPYLSYSGDGNYLLLQQQFFTDFALNKDRPNRVEVLELSSGKIILSIEHVHSASFFPDGKSLLTLIGEYVVVWDISSGKDVRRFTPGNTTNAVAIDPQATVIAVSQKPSEKDLSEIPSIRDDKKAVKEALKFREVVYLYDAKTFQRVGMVKEIFDIVFSMKFSPDGKRLYLFNAPNTRFKTTQGASRSGYIQVINMADSRPERLIFPTNATEPQYKESADRRYFAATSIEQRFRVLNSTLVFNRETGEVLKNFVNDFKLLENKHFGRSSFEFLPDGSTIALGYGFKLALWQFEK